LAHRVRACERARVGGLDRWPAGWAGGLLAAADAQCHTARRPAVGFCCLELPGTAMGVLSG
jgi:hypothetical protein